MDHESCNSSVGSELNYSPLPFQSSALSYIPRRYDRSLIVPSKLSERKYNSHGTVVHLPPLKFSSGTIPSEEEDFLALRSPTTDGELALFKEKFTRLRVKLSQSHEVNRHAYEKVRKKKKDLRRAIHDQNKLIDQLLATSVELDNKIKALRDEITKQCHKRDNHEMRQLKFQRTCSRLNKSTDLSSELLQRDTKTQLIEKYNSYLSQLENEYKEELAHRDNQIENLKEKLSENFHYQANEHLKLLRAIEQAFSLENEKCEILQEYVVDYETNVYRAKKPCCIASLHRLSKISTQLRLYLNIELTLNELFHSSCSCGQFKRCYQTFMRLHNK